MKACFRARWFNNFAATALVAIFCIVYGSPEARGAVPQRFNYQGQLKSKTGALLQGTQTLYFGIYEGGSASVANSGTKIYEESAVVEAVDGVVSHPVGSGTARFGSFNSTRLAGIAAPYLQVAVGTPSNVMLPRTQIESVPYSMVSGNGDARIPLSGPAPVIIDKPGSYYLTGNIKGAAGKSGITITAQNVTLDLNGFTVEGGPNSDCGIWISHKSAENATIMNGHITNWGAQGNTNPKGIWAPGTQGVSISNVNVSNISGAGIAVGGRSSIKDCHVKLCGQSGFEVSGPGAVVTNCTSTSNTLSGFAVIYEGRSAVFENCVASYNADGFTAGANSGCVYFNCTSTRNEFHGYYVLDGQISNSTAYENTTGIAVMKGNVTNSISNRNRSTGIQIRLHSTASECVANDNGRGGFNCSDSDVSGCSAARNNTGFVLWHSSHLVNSKFQDNAVGVDVLYDENLIENNFGRFNDVGIVSKSPVSDNVIIGNVIRSKYGNAPGNFKVNGPHNVIGTILNSSNLNSSSNPRSNLSY